MLPTIQVWEDRLGQRDASRESGSHCDCSLEGMDSNLQSPELRSSLPSLPGG
jgi:hypothetical protein